MVDTKTSLFWILLAKVLFCLALERVQIRQITPNKELCIAKNASTHELTCISEDDDAALVWNYDFNLSEPIDHFNNFEPVKPMKRMSLDSECAVWRSNQCLTTWDDSHNLETVSSLTNPMAPVVDYRWEGFKEYVVNNATPIKVLQLNSTDDTVVFSVRGTQNLEIYLCQREEFRISSCYLMKLAVDGKYSVIENCQPKESQCQEEARSVAHESAILDAHEWRTFRLQLIRNEQKIKVFRDTDENAFLEGNRRKSQSINSLWISSGPAARIKFHTYNYILFTKQNMQSTTPEFDWPDNHFCINMLVSICPSCQLTVGLTRDNTDYTKSITGDGQFHQSGLRTWRTVKLNFHLISSSTGRSKLFFIPGLEGGNHEVMWWAIDNLRLCELNDGVRKSTITLPFSDNTGTRVNIKCQKLLRNVTVVADSCNKLPLQNTGRLGDYVQRLSKSFPPNNTSECNDTSGEYFEEKTANRKARGVRCLDVIPGKTSFELRKTSDFSVCQEDTGYYLLTVNDIRQYKSLGNQTCPQFPCAYTFVQLEPFTAYNVVVESPSGIIILNETAKTLESAPGEIRDLSFESISATSVTGKWNPPERVNDIIRNYTVSIKRVDLLGCKDVGKPSPAGPEIMKNVTSITASFSGLHPYARYRFEVIANTIEPGPAVLKVFETAQLVIPTSKVSNLRLINESCLAWDHPTDCTTVTGPTSVTELFFVGLNEWAKNSVRHITTARHQYDSAELKLLPYTEYRVCAYVLRKHRSQKNSSNCQSFRWTTKPVASPAPKNIQIYEADALRRTISIIWKPPYPPTGEIESYQVLMTNRDKMITRWSIKASELKKCRQSHVCVENLSLPSNVSINDDLTLQIFARNVNVTEDGAMIPKSFILDNLYNKAPDQPQQLEVAPRKYGIVTLQWSHPSLTPTKIVRFQIRADCLRTNLTTHPCKNISPTYYNIENPEEKAHSTELYLLTSTEYRLQVMALNYRNKMSAPITKDVSTSVSVSFASNDGLRVISAEDVVALKVPAVLNATIYTTVVIKVEGLSLCAPNLPRNESSSKNNTNITMDWDALKYSVNRSQPVNFIFELNKYYGVEQNCRFQRQETYVFNAILEDPGLERPLILTTPELSFTPSPQQSQNWLVAIPILVMSLSLFILFILYRKHKKTKIQKNDSQSAACDLRDSVRVNSRVQSSTVQDLLLDPLHKASSENLEGQTSCAQNVPLEPPYMIPRNLSEQTSHNLQNVASAPVYMNISNNSRRESSHAQYVPSDQEYWEISDNSTEQPSDPQDLALAPLYMNTLDNSKGESSYSRDTSLEPEYSIILDDSREGTSYAQDIPLAPVYMNILDYSREHTRHAHDTP